MSTEESSSWSGQDSAARALAFLDSDQLSTRILSPSAASRKAIPFETKPGWPHVPGYEILSEIGSGAMGVVYKAVHLDLRRTVALKMLRGAACSDQFFRERFQAEAEAVARLQHPNIIQVFEFGATVAPPGECFPALFISLEHVSGGSLAQQVGRKQSPQQIAAIVEKLARATHYAHRLGIIHRDLKPSNVLMSLDDEPKIADFGVAKQIGDDKDSRLKCPTVTGTLIGTPEYMAPEQVAGATPSSAMDIYALGVILYELLTSRLPLQGATAVETLDLVRHHEPVSPRRTYADLPRDLETICLKCLEKQPAHRYVTALDLADDLRRFQDDLPIQARPIGDWERFRRWCRRNPFLAVSATGVVAVFVTAFLLVTMSYLRAEHARQEEAHQTLEAERREKLERWERYRANIGAAASALQLHNTGAAQITLDAAPFEYHNWEWNHFYSRLDSSQYLLGSLETKATRGLISRHGSRVLIIKQQGTRASASVWDVNQKRELIAYSQPESIFRALISPDGNSIVYSEGNSLVLRDLDTDRVRARIPGHDKPIYTTKFTSDSTRLITCSSENRICTWNARTGELLSSFSGPGALIDGSAISDDGRLAAVTALKEDDPYLINLQTGVMLPRLAGHKHRMEVIAFNHKGDRVATIVSYPDLTTRLWDTSTGKQLATDRAHSNGILAVAFSPDDSRLATCSLDQTICLRDGRTGQIQSTLRGHNGCVRCIAFSPDGKRLVSASQDRTVRLWDASTGEALALLHGHTGDVFSVAFTADGEKIVSCASDGTIRIWDAQLVERDGVLRGHSSFVYHVAVHPDGQRAASAGWDGTARVWDMNTGRQLARFDHGPKCIVSAVGFHPDGKVLATRGRDAVRLWDLETGQEVDRFAVPTDGWRDTRVAFSPDGRLLASGCANSEVRVWDVNGRKEVAILRGHDDQIRDVVFSPDGLTIASAGDKEDRTVRLWDVKTHTLLRTLRGHQDGVYALAYHPDGKMLASAGVDGTIRFWDCASGRELGHTIRLGSNAYGIAFTPDGARIVGACADNAIRFWETTTGQEVAELRGHEDYVHAVAFSPDGDRLVSASGDRTVRIWDTLSSRARQLLKKSPARE